MIDREHRQPYRPPTHDTRTCLTCGADIAAPPSRIRWVFGMHVERCTTATPEARTVFRRTRKWPRKTH